MQPVYSVHILWITMYFRVEERMTIEFINYPFVFTDQGTRHLVEELKGTPRVGAELRPDA